MVSVRKSHQFVSVDFKHWITDQAFVQTKQQALEALWIIVAPYFQKQETRLLKSMEMVEILSSLNLDSDSLSAAFLTPLLENNLITKDFVTEHFSENIIMLCQGEKVEIPNENDGLLAMEVASEIQKQILELK